MSMKDGRVRVRDIEIHYQITDFTDPWTKPQTVLLHHGFARNLDLWYAWVPLLCRDFRVVTFDSRGCGDSTVPPEGYRYSVDELANDAVALMDALGLDRVHWGAEASGGIVGIHAAIRFPQRIASLTLCNTPVKIPQATHDIFVAEEVRKFGTGYWARKSAPNRFDTGKLSEGYLEWSIAQHDRTRPHAAIAIHEMLQTADSWPVLPDLKVPVLVLAGDGSKIATLDEMEKMVKRIPDAKLVVFKGYGQGIAFSNSEACAAAMRDFIRVLPAD